MALCYTADTHFGHENVMKFCDRPFSSMEEMDAVLISNMSERVVQPPWSVPLILGLSDMVSGAGGCMLSA